MNFKWDVYRCENDHLIIVQRKKTWPDYVQGYFMCDICRKLAVYEGSTDSLKEVEKEGEW